MKLEDVVRIVNGEMLSVNADLSKDVKGCCGSDLMSDVLSTSIKPDTVLLTGLCNPQVVRTAQIADIIAIILVRGKRPPKETIELADKEAIPLISSPLSMFEICGKLYQAGLPSMEVGLAE